jgi:hypothetical protein
MEVTNDTEEEASWPRKFAAASPVATAKLTDQKGTSQIEVRKDKDNNYYAKSSAVEGVFKTSADLGEALSKNTEEFRNKKLFDFAFNEPEKVELKDGDRTYSFTKSGSEWKSLGKTVEPGSVQQLIDRLRDLSAVRFADSSAGTQVGEYAVTLPNNKDAERVFVRKQGDTFYAQRASEPDVFIVEGRQVTELAGLAAAVKEVAPPPKPAEKK